MTTLNTVNSTFADNREVSAKPRARQLLRFIADALYVRRQRMALLSLDARMLADIGLSQADVHRETHRSLLDLPMSGQLPGSRR